MIRQPEPHRSSVELVERLNIHMVWMKHHKKAEEAIRIHYAGAFGIMQALRISPEGQDFVSILVKDSEGTQRQIVVSVSQCSFMFSLFTPTADEPAEKVILGFAEGQNT